MRAAVINSTTNIVENVIELDSHSLWQAPNGFYIVFSDSASVGDWHFDNQFHKRGEE